MILFWGRNDDKVIYNANSIDEIVMTSIFDTDRREVDQNVIDITLNSVFFFFY